MDLAAILAATTLEPEPHQDKAGISAAADREDASTSAAPAQPALGFISQSACHLHRYTRGESDAHIVERADRLRSVFMGAAIAHGRLIASRPDKGKSREPSDTEVVSDLEKLLGGLNIRSSQCVWEGWPFSITTTPRRVKLDSPAVHLAHGADYSARLSEYIADVAKRHARKESEVPEPLSQGDLYLCQDSLDAMEGAIGACCEAVDQICSPPSLQECRRFVSIRPPGHHCESDTPMGFCWLNNVAVAAAHAHLEHGIDRVIVFDIDLHHGNGTQQIAWRLNALANKALKDRQKPPSPRKGSPKKPLRPAEPTLPILQLFYGSLHDVDSYPCEELDPILIANASVNIFGGGGSQYITNVHLEPYQNTADFHTRLYPAYCAQLMGSAAAFARKTNAAPEKTLVIVSAGFDASEHEYASMSRHGAKVPTSFFSRFARDVTDFARVHAGGKLLAVLEGGYSQRALCSGAGNFITGLVDAPEIPLYAVDSWWTLDQIDGYEKALSLASSKVKKSAAKKDDAGSNQSWRVPTLAIYSKLIETIPPKPLNNKPRLKNITPPSSTTRTTRSRYNSPAVASHVTSNFQSLLNVPCITTQEKDLPPETPGSSPLNGKTVQSVSSPPVTPSIRFTFKAGEKKSNQPIFQADRYRDVGGDSTTSVTSDTSGSE